MMKTDDLTSRLNKRITLQQESGVADEAGGYVVGWQDVAEMWAEITPLDNGRTEERFIAMRQESRLYYRVIIRFREGVDARMRIVYGNRVFRIVSMINPKEANERLVFLAVEGAAV